LLAFFGISKGALRYHLQQLERSGEIRSSLESGRSIFHPTSTVKLDIELQEMSRSQLRVFNIIQGRPGLTRSEIMDMTQLSKDALRYHIRRLSKKGLIEKTEVEGKDRFYPIPKEEVRKRTFLELVRRLVDGEIDEATFVMMSGRL
jgi:predicted transcriptional regulator